MKGVGSLLYKLAILCGCMQISDLRFEPYGTRAKDVLEKDSRFAVWYSKEQLQEAREYVCG